MEIANNESYIYMNIPNKFYNVYIELLSKLANCGVNIIKDCTADCNCKNKQIYKCWNLFQSACAAYQFGDAENIKKSILIIDYIKAQLNITDKEIEDVIGAKIILKKTKDSVGIDGGSIRIDYTTEGNVGTVIAEDNTHGQFTYFYGENYIILTAVSYKPVEKTETFVITIKGTNGGYSTFNVIRTRPYIEFSPSSIIRDYFGYDENGYETGVDIIVEGDVGTITLSSNVDWMASPGQLREDDELYCPITLSINNEDIERIGTMLATTSKGYTAELEVLQESKNDVYTVYTGLRNTNPDEVAFTSDEISKGEIYNIRTLSYNINSTENAKCKWWAVPKGLTITSITDDIGEENIRYAEKVNIAINGVDYIVYYLWSDISSTTNYSITIS